MRVVPASLIRYNGCIDAYEWIHDPASIWIYQCLFIIGYMSHSYPIISHWVLSFSVVRPWQKVLKPMVTWAAPIFRNLHRFKSWGFLTSYDLHIPKTIKNQWSMESMDIIYYIFSYHCWLVVFRHPSEQYEFVSWDYPNIWKTNVPNHQPDWI